MIYDMMAIGLLIMLLVSIFDKDTLRVEWSAISKFLSFMALVTMLRVCALDFLYDKAPDIFNHVYNPEILEILKPWRLALVFWEDAFFAMPIYYAQKWLKKKYWITLAIISSVIFGTFHVYQGLFAMFITMVYPYFISVRYGKKVGFGTVMICHMLYDFITVYTLYFLMYLV